MTETRNARTKAAEHRDEDSDAATRVKRSADGRTEDEATRIDCDHDQTSPASSEPSETVIQDRREADATRIQPGPDSGDAPDDEKTRRQISDEAQEHGATELRGPEQATEAVNETVSGASTSASETSTDTRAGTFEGSLGIGSILRGRFRIESVLGEGGMGTVFGAVDLLKQEARDEQVHVALKVMKPDIGDAEMTFRGLQREARRAQQLAHPNIVTVYDFDRADGHIYMTMEYLRGQPVSGLLKQNRHGLEPELARDITMQIGAGLAYAHAEGIVHVDLKPQNVFMLERGRVKILDFGIAKAYQEKRPDRVEDAFSGYSPPFASPQIIRRERPTPRDDVFALGILAYALFTGKHPFDWKPADQAEKAGLRPAHHSVFKRSQWRAIQAALAFEADARPADAGEFIKRFAPSKVKRAALAVSAGSVVAALAFVLLFKPQPGPEVPFDQLAPELQTRIESELADANMFSELGDLDSALQLYQAVLTLHPGNLEATRGMNDTVERALQRIERLTRDGSLSASAARANMEAMLAYESLPARARDRIEQAAREL